MEWFLSEGPHPIVGAGGAMLAAAALVAALWLRQRALANRATVAAVFAADAGSVLRVVAIALAVLSASVAFGVDGLGIPLWLVLAMIGGATALGLLTWRWYAAVGAQEGWRRAVAPKGRGSVASTSWQIGLVAGAGLGLLTYFATDDHSFGHQPHWTLALLGLLLGYALGIAAVTPRLRFQPPAPKR